VGVGGPWRVSMGCMDELMDKNLPYFVGDNLATLYITHINTSLQHTMTSAAARHRVIFRRVVLRRRIECQSGINFKTALGRRSTSDRPRYCTQTRRTPPLPLASTTPRRTPRRASSQLTTSQCQTDRVIIPKHAGFRRCHWPRPHHAAPLAALARS